MIAAIKDRETVRETLKRTRDDIFILPKEYQNDEINAYNRSLETLSSEYLALIGVEDMLLDTYGRGANLLYLNGNFQPAVFSPTNKYGPFVYAAGYSVFQSHAFDSPQPPRGGLFIGFVGETQIDGFTKKPYGVPESFGVIHLRHIVEAPFAFDTRLPGKTPITASMGAKNLKLLQEINPRAKGKYGLGELRSFLLDASTLAEAHNVVQRGIEKDVARGKTRRFARPFPL